MSRKFGLVLAIFGFSLAAFGQEPAPSGGWRRFDSAPAQPPYNEQAPGQPGQAGAPVPGPNNNGPYNNGPYTNGQYNNAPYNPVPPPAVLNLNTGTILTVRVDQPLSSDHNKSGDTFTASLVQPLVVNGFIVASRGQTLVGRVADADKGGRVQGTSRLALELTELSLVDGQQLPIRSQLMNYNAGTSIGRDATAIGATTAIGAVIGGAAAGGTGAGIGAGAGALASTIGVLITRGHPTVVYPESVLTFRTVEPVSISTERSAQAFEPVRPEDYPPQVANGPVGPRPAPCYYGGGYGPVYGPGYGPYYGYPGYYPGWYGPGYYGGVYIRTGPRYYYGGRGHR